MTRCITTKCDCRVRKGLIRKLALKQITTSCIGYLKTFRGRTILEDSQKLYGKNLNRFSNGWSEQFKLENDSTIEIISWKIFVFFYFIDSDKKRERLSRVKIFISTFLKSFCFLILELQDHNKHFCVISCEKRFIFQCKDITNYYYTREKWIFKIWILHKSFQINFIIFEVLCIMKREFANLNWTQQKAIIWICSFSVNLGMKK